MSLAVARVLERIRALRAEDPALFRARAVLILALKDLRLLWRDKFGLFWVIVFPLLIAVLFGSIYRTGGGSAGSMRVAVIDQQQSEEHQAVPGQLQRILLALARPGQEIGRIGSGGSGLQALPRQTNGNREVRDRTLLLFLQGSQIEFGKRQIFHLAFGKLLGEERQGVQEYKHEDKEYGEKRRRGHEKKK